MSAPTRVILEADGGSRGNPGPAGFGALIRDADTGRVVAEVAESIGRATNNVAEYRGLIAGLALYGEHTPEATLEVRMDSKLVIEQMAGRWKVKHPDMRPLALTAKRLAPPDARWTWIPRERNKDADRLANMAMDAAAGVPPVPATAAVDPVPAAADTATPAGGPNTPLLGWSAQRGEPTTLVFLRHGVTVHTAERRFSGPGGDDPGLIEEGWEQARRAAAALAAEGGFDAIVASPLQRTRDTAASVSQALGLPVTIEEDFQEAGFGDWDGYTLEEVEQRWPDELAAWLASFDVRPPAGESIVEVQRRVEGALRRTLATYADQKVVVVSHVNPIKLAVRYCLDAPLASMNKLLLAPASLTTLSFYESGASALRQFSAVPAGGTQAATGV